MGRCVAWMRTFAIVVVASVTLVACGSDGNGDTEPIPTATTAANTESPSDEQVVKALPTGPIPTAIPAPESSYDLDGDGSLSWSELEQGVTANMGMFEFPSGYATSVEAILERVSLPPGWSRDETSFENGSEISLPGNAHFCAWSFTLYDAMASGDAELQEISIDHLETDVEIIPAFRLVKSDMHRMIDKASLGDVSDLKQYTDQVCSRDIFQEQDSSPEAGGD